MQQQERPQDGRMKTGAGDYSILPGATANGITIAVLEKLGWASTVLLYGGLRANDFGITLLLVLIF